jgi:hypothetical protein
VAVTLHGSALLTRDTDVMYDSEAENIERLAVALAGLEVRLRGVPEDLPFKPDPRTLRAGQNFTFDSKFGPLDLLGYADGAPSYDDLRNHAVRMELGDREVLVASVDDLIAMKAAAGRSKDLRAIDDLEAIRQLDPGE